MKRFVSSILRQLQTCSLQAVCFTIVLMVPNVLLCVTESMCLPACVTNILLPLGFYMMLVSMFRYTGWAVWVMLPFSIFAAFQIVLIFLYGGSVIAVDMFLNVVTTNMSEACELLRNLGTAIFTVVILYLPPLVWATVSLVKGWKLSYRARCEFRRYGFFLFLTGALVAIVCSVVDSRFSVVEDVFPVNVINNIKIAVDRTIDVRQYGENSSDFCYGAVSNHDKELDEFYVMVIGETSRACNWQLCGYGRATNTRLSRRDNVTFFRRALSESNTTHKSVPMLMSHITACNYDSINYCKSIITAFKEAGFNTTFISNQASNHSYTEFFGREADRCCYLADTLGRHRYDGEMLPLVAGCLADTVCRKQFVVIHSYGSHFKYAERYPESFGSFKPDKCDEVNSDARDILVNAYDNTIEYTDMWLDELIGMIERSGRHAALVYAADHGEDIMDDDRGRFLHASPTPTYYQLHVAMLTWVSGSYNDAYPEKLAMMRRHSDVPVSSTSSFYNTLIDLGGIFTCYYNDELSVASDCYRRPRALYLDDKNDGIDIYECGLKNEDISIIDELELL